MANDAHETVKERYCFALNTFIRNDCKSIRRRPTATTATTATTPLVSTEALSFSSPVCSKNTRSIMLTMTAPPFILMLLLLCLLTFPTTMAQLPLLWSDEFDSSSMPDANVWSVDTGGGGWGNAEIQTYSEDNVKVENGNLVITTTSEKDEWVGRTFESGRIRSNTKLEFMYGTVEAKIQVPDVGNGLWPAFWMLGTTFPNVAQWPESGEIDIMELCV